MPSSAPWAAHLPVQTGSRMDAQTLKEFERLLLEMREQIEALAETRKKASSTVELDQARTGRLSRVGAMQDQEMAKAGHQRAEQELRQIDAALKRIEEGSYGECQECGNDIAEGRLKANPAVTLCIKCAAAKERG